MSSTDLADARTKHNIEVLEKEALEHSILQKVIAPRAKITHKGFEAIEDVSGSRNADAAREEEEQRMAMEKRERERLARLRMTQHHGQEASPSTPIDPSFGSPLTVTGAAPSWGAPPSVPSNIPQNEETAALQNRPQPRPLFVPTASDFTSADQGLDLADLIHIDEDMSAQDVPPSSNPQERMSEQLTTSMTGSAASPVIASGPSPFAPAKPAESPLRTSFNLNTLWTESGQTEPPKDAPQVQTETDATVVPASPLEEPHEEGIGESMDLGSDNDQDLDAMLDRAEQADKQAAPLDISSLAEVWDGQVCLLLAFLRF